MALMPPRHLRAITCFVPIEPIPADVSTLEFASGDYPLLPHEAKGDHGAAIERERFADTTRFDLASGDALLFGDHVESPGRSCSTIRAARYEGSIRCRGLRSSATSCTSRAGGPPALLSSRRSLRTGAYATRRSRSVRCARPIGSRPDGRPYDAARRPGLTACPRRRPSATSRSCAARPRRTALAAASPARRGRGDCRARKRS